MYYVTKNKPSSLPARCKFIQTNTRRSVGKMTQSSDRKRPLVTGFYGTLLLFQHQKNTTLVVSMLAQHRMKLYGWSNFLMM